MIIAYCSAHEICFYKITARLFSRRQTCPRIIFIRCRKRNELARFRFIVNFLIEIYEILWFFLLFYLTLLWTHIVGQFIPVFLKQFISFVFSNFYTKILSFLLPFLKQTISITIIPPITITSVIILVVNYQRHL